MSGTSTGQIVGVLTMLVLDVRVRAGGIPIFFSRSAVTRELFDFVVETRPHTTSGRMEETVKRELLNYAV